jgi:hypothetical protein
MEDLILNVHVLYDERHTTHPSPPLPPTPAGEPVPNFSYGSKRTKIASVPPMPAMKATGPYLPSSPQDFTPRLPPRPTNSIHPSLRAGAGSPTRGRSDTPPLPSQPHRRNKPSFDETPPSSPSAASTLYETDDSSSHDQAIRERFTTPIANLRSSSPLRPATIEVAEAPQHNDAPPPI